MADTDVAKTLELGEHRRSNRRWWVAGAVLALIAVGLWAWRPGAPDVSPWVTAEAARTTIVATVTATGTVEPTNLVEVSSELSGSLASVEVDFDDTVEVGQPLARLDTGRLEAQVDVRRAGLDAAIARVAMAEASLAEARAIYEAGLELDRRGVQSQQVSIAQKTAYTRAQADLQSAIADRSLAEANLDLQQADLEMACICSPIRGVVLDRTADVGQIVTSSLSAPVLFLIAEDLTKMELQVDIDEADIGRVSVGDEARFTVEAYDDRSFPAVISEIRFASQTIAGVVTYKAVLSVDNADMLLRPGMTATTDIIVATAEDVLSVPNAALRFAPPVAAGDTADDGGFFGAMRDRGGASGGDAGTLWVLRDGEPREIAVETGISDGRVTQILSGELEPGDRVVTDLVDG